MTIAVAGAVALLAAGKNVYAQESPFTTIVERIAQRFNLNQTDVQSVFDEMHEERHAQMHENLETRLSTAVSEGTITEAQKQAILTKFDEMPANHEQMRAEMEAWMSANGLTQEQLQNIGFGLHGGPFMHGLKMGYRMGYSNSR